MPADAPDVVPRRNGLFRPAGAFEPDGVGLRFRDSLRGKGFTRPSSLASQHHEAHRTSRNKPGQRVPLTGPAHCTVVMEPRPARSNSPDVVRTTSACDAEAPRLGSRASLVAGSGRACWAGGCFVAQGGEALGEEPGDVHLADAELGSDFALGAFFEEP